MESLTKKRTIRRRRTTHRRKRGASGKTTLPVKISSRGTATIGGFKHHHHHLCGVSDFLGIENELGRKSTSALVDVLFYGGGMVLGGLAQKALNKLLKTDATDAPKWKKHLVPGGLILAGLGGAIFLPKGLVKSEAMTGILNKISAGVAISGTISEINLLTGKSLLGDIGLDATEDEAIRAEYYKTAEETLRKINETQDFVPELPENEDMVDGATKSVSATREQSVLGDDNEIL